MEVWSCSLVSEDGFETETTDAVSSSLLPGFDAPAGAFAPAAEGFAPAAEGFVADAFADF